MSPTATGESEPFVVFSFLIGLQGRIGPPLAPTGVKLVADDLSNWSGEYDPVTWAVFSPDSVEPLVNLSTHPWYVSSYALSGNGSIVDVAYLANVSAQHHGEYFFELPLFFTALAAPIPAGTTAVNEFHFSALLEGLSSAAWYNDTVTFVDSYS